ncbi:MAG: CAP domain-containing protein [Chloroflexota bacterium]|nr:MAG: CAP domain-containing protein [Chloroflexota bacterium]
MGKLRIIFGCIVLIASVVLGADLSGVKSRPAAAQSARHVQYLPQILSSYCLGYPAIQPTDAGKDRELETQINSLRQANGLPALISVAEVSQAALRHSNDMAAKSFVSHTGSDGSDPGQRLQEACYGWRGYGEIIAMGYNTPQEVLAGWMDSPPHQGILLSDLFTEFGAGYGYDSVGEDHYWTVDFGLPGAQLLSVQGDKYTCTYYHQYSQGQSWLRLTSDRPCPADWELVATE